ncbi:MAG: GntR family transcriptional regulator [Actinomycetota bacterium]|nr:GntR family transcriptional regulator [Actinomycetota bacterium]MDP9475948.1 GntR family transcriptional regulator [Actinomycetota bacterium]
MSDVLTGVRLDHSSPVPLYYQAARVLEQAIEDGRLPRGSKLDNELHLAEQLGISRPTMRAAIKQLVDKGLLIRRRGVGTTVAPKPVRRAVALTSLYDDLKESGRDPKTHVLALEEAPCPPQIAEQLGLGPGAPVLRLDRLRLAGSDPIALMHNVVPVGLLEIEREDLERTGLYYLFRESGIAPHIATQRVGARKAGTEEAELLEIEPGDPVLSMTRTAYDTSGRPIEYGSHSYPAESYWLEMMLVEL